MNVGAYEVNQIIYGNCEDVLSQLPEETIDLTVTSPPYYNARSYSHYPTYAAYLDFLERVFSKIFRLTKPSRMVIVNISPVIIERAKRSEQSSRIAIPFHFVPLMERIGFEFLEDIIWKKPDGAAINRNGGFFQHRKPVAYKPNTVTEYIFVFKKPAPFLIDKILKDEPIEGEYDRTNVWEIQPETQSFHPAPFPEKLVEKCLRYYSYTQEIVLDPFSGSGTTAVVCKRLNRVFLGIENVFDYWQSSVERIKYYAWQPELALRLN